MNIIKNKKKGTAYYEIDMEQSNRLNEEPIQITPFYLLKEFFGLNHKSPSPEEFFKDHPWYSNSHDTLITRYFSIKERTNKLFKEIITKYDLNSNTDIIDLTNIKWFIRYDTKLNVEYIYIESIENPESIKNIYSNRLIDTKIIEEKDITFLKFENGFNDFNTEMCKKTPYCIVLLNKNKYKKQ